MKILIECDCGSIKEYEEFRKGKSVYYNCKACKVSGVYSSDGSNLSNTAECIIITYGLISKYYIHRFSLL